jgi:hypothetical protein
MDKVRGGVFSGAMVLAGLSATLISGLIAIGIRQVTLAPSHPMQVHILPASGEVSVPDATPSPQPSAHGSPPVSVADLPVSSGAMTRTAAGASGSTTASTRTTTGTTTGTRSSAGTVSSPAPTTAATPVTAPADSSSPSSSPAPTKPGNGNGNGNGNANGQGTGQSSSNGNGHKH